MKLGSIGKADWVASSEKTAHRWGLQRILVAGTPQPASRTASFSAIGSLAYVTGELEDAA